MLAFARDSRVVFTSFCRDPKLAQRMPATGQVIAPRAATVGNRSVGMSSRLNWPNRGIRDAMSMRMNLADVVTKMVEFVRAGYPQGVPATDCFALLAVLRRRLTDDEVAAVAAQLAARGELKIDTAEISAAITRITEQPPSLEELDRVQHRLEAIGWSADPES
jgi:hypothetical protein